MLNPAYRAKQLIILVGDVVGFCLGFWLSLAVRSFAPPSLVQIEKHLPLFGVTFLLWIVINYINGLYDLHLKVHKKTFYRHFTETAVIALAVGITFFYLHPDKSIAPKTILFLTVLFGYGISFMWRHGADVLLRGARRLQTRVLFIGTTPETKELLAILHDHPEKGYQVVGHIDPDRDTSSDQHVGRAHTDMRLDTLNKVINKKDVDVIVIAPHLREDEAVLRQLYQLLFLDVELLEWPSFYEMVTGRIPPSTFSEGWFLDHLRHRHVPMYERVRTIVDYLAVLLMGIVYVVLFPLITTIIKLTSRGPIFIKQKRVGRDGKLFTLYKFRSMYALSPDGSAEVNGVQFATKDDTRITPFGKLLRRTRLDELPQILNLVKRDVTLVGPRPERPEIVEELERQMPYYPLRHIVRPGLTGWALIHQDYTDTLETSLQKLQYDLYYIKNRGPLLDLSILLKTVNKIIRLQGQ